MHEPFRTIVIALVAGATGAVLVTWFGPAGKPAMQQAVPGSGSEAEMLARIESLEEQLAGTAGSADTVVQFPGVPGPVVPARPDDGRTQGGPVVVEDGTAQVVRWQRERLGTELRKSGWSDAEIESLESLMDASRLEAEERMYMQMRRSIEKYPEAEAFWGQSRHLRNSLGEEKYEQYLKALGRPVQLKVNNVVKGSAGDIAGLKSGDIIRRYGSDRIYNEHDLMMSAVRGEPGEAVTIEVERDGSIFYLSVPRGPLGATQSARMVMH